MRRIGLFVHLGKPAAIAAVEQAITMLRSIEVPCCIDPEGARRLSKETQAYVTVLPFEEFDRFADVIMSFGGDGTMLKACHIFLKSELPVMGINIGKLGFLAEFSVEQLDAAISAVMTGDYIIEHRSVLESRINDQVAYALNDFVVHKQDFSRMITVKAYIDGKLISSYRADALIVSTPTGSTAYSLASGGPIIAPACDVFCITPVAPHALTVRPLVVPDNVEIAVEPFSESGHVQLLADGMTVQPLGNNQRVPLYKSQYTFKLLRQKSRTYYDLLKEKLLWATDTVQHTGVQKAAEKG